MRDRSRLLLIVMFILLGPLVAFALPQLAVLEALLAAGMDPTVGPLITSKIEEEFVKSGKYTVLDRANIDRVLREKEFQIASGVVRNEEIRRAGEYLGADFVVVASVSRIGQTYVISAKMIDVVSGEIAAQTSHEQQGPIDVLLEIAKVVGSRLAGTQAAVAKAEEPKKAEAPAPPKEPKPPRAPREPLEFKRFVAGVKAGGNLAGILWDDYYTWGWAVGSIGDEEPYSIFGFTVGAYLALNLNRFLAFQTELNYSQKGYNIYAYESGWDPDGVLLAEYGYVTSEWVFNYLEVPVLLKIALPRRFSVYGIAGFSASFFLGGTVYNAYDDFFAQVDFDLFNDNPEDVENLIPLKSFDAGLVLGAGVDFELKSTVLNLEARYTMGLIAVTTDNIFTNSVFSFTAGVGYRF